METVTETVMGRGCDGGMVVWGGQFQRVSPDKYLVCFNSLAVHWPWGESALRYRFYKGLPAHLKDKICKGDGKPNTLSELWKKAQNIDA